MPQGSVVWSRHDPNITIHLTAGANKVNLRLSRGTPGVHVISQSPQKTADVGPNIHCYLGFNTELIKRFTAEVQEKKKNKSKNQCKYHMWEIMTQRLKAIKA